MDGPGGKVRPALGHCLACPAAVQDSTARPLSLDSKLGCRRLLVSGLGCPMAMIVLIIIKVYLKCSFEMKYAFGGARNKYP